MASKFYTLLESIIDGINGSAKTINGVGPNTAGEVTVKEPINLLDNSDFRDPVNQQGLTEYVGVNIPIVDRWNTDDTSRSYAIEPTVALFEGVGLRCNYESSTSMELRSGLVYQIVNKSRLTGKTNFTLAAKIFVEGVERVMVKSGDISEGNIYLSVNELGLMNFEEMDDSSGNYKFEVMAGSTIPDAKIVWAALYEGAYTEDTLPEYKTKDRLAELAECYRYYRVFNFTNYIAAGLSTSELYFNVDLGGIPMRSQPTVTMVTKPTTVYVEGASASWSVTDSTIELRDYADGDTVLGVYCKSSATATNAKLRAVRVNNVGFIFDARQ